MPEQTTSLGRRGVRNSEAAKILLEIGALLELKGESVFKIRAYQNAAKAIEFLPEEVDKMAQEERLREIPGVGEAISAKLGELIRTGRIDYLEKLKAEFPSGINNLLNVPGLGPQTALMLARALHITTLSELQQAIEDGRVAALPRMGNRKAEKLLERIKAHGEMKREQRIPLGQILPVADSLIASFKDAPGLSGLCLAGSLRRYRDTIGDINVIGAAHELEPVITAFVRLPQVQEIVKKSDRQARVILANGIQVELNVTAPENFGLGLLCATGSKEHVAGLKEFAQARGFLLETDGVRPLGDGILKEFATESDVYERLGLDYIPPEIREGRHEIDLASRHLLPRLVDLPDIKGDLHVHTKWSDGASTIEKILESARIRGYSYVAITDHGLGVGITAGVDEERLRQQIELIKALNRESADVQILAGVEADIQPDGSINARDEILSELDIVFASIHSRMKQSEDEMTRRLIRAIENPHVDVIAHPTARLLGERPPVALDVQAVFEAAARHGKVLEISAMPSRLDLKDDHIVLAREMGIKMAINSDAHRPEHLDFMHFGVGMARRGWCQAGDILNTLSYEDLLTALKKPA